MSPRLLTLDIETSPNLGYVWQLHNTDVHLPQLVEQSEVICFAAKWLDQPRVEFRSVYHDGKEAMVERAHALLDEADGLIGYNSAGFDRKHLQREILLAGFPPPSPFTDIDLYRTVKKHFRFASSKLQNVAQELGIGSKVPHTGFELWRQCMTGTDDEKAKAWRPMRRYCIGDTRLTEALYWRLLPWISGHPHHGLFGEDGVDCCSRCGSLDLQRRGYATKLTGRYQRFQCQACGGWSTSGRREAGVDVRAA